MRFNKRRAYFGILLLFLLVFLAEYVIAPGKEVQFNNEQQLIENGLLQRINEEVSIGNQKLLFTKVVYDVDSITFAYKGDAQLPASVFGINASSTRQLSSSIFEHIGAKPISPGCTTYSGSNYHTVTVPHNLELVRQKIIVDLNLNGYNQRISLDFPGEIIAATTLERKVDANGNKVDNAQQAVVRVVVGINFLKVERKGLSDFIVLDEKDRIVLSRGNAVNTSGEAEEVFAPLPFPRGNITMRIFPEENLVLLKR